MPPKDTKFKAGEAKGRPKGAVGWKTRAVNLIGEVYADREKEAKRYIKGLPIEDFLNKFIIPFLPKTIDLGLSEEFEDFVHTHIHRFDGNGGNGKDKDGGNGKDNPK